MSIFFFWMLVSSALGFLKILLLAQVMSRPDFGNYVSLIGAATLSGVLFSFGLVEGTTKRFPRMWVAGRGAAILTDSKSIARVLVRRFVLVTAALAVVAAFGVFGYAPIDFILAGIIGLCTALLSLSASALRASDSTTAFQRFSFARNGLSFAAASSGALLLGWKGAMAGEATANMLAMLVARLSIRSAYRAAPGPADALPGTPSTEFDKAGGWRLYWATLCSSSTALGDRALINAVSGASLAGAYGVVSLIFQIGQLLVNILAQRVGPLIIKAGFVGNDSHGSAGSLRRQWAALGGVGLGLICVVLGFRAINFPPGFFAKYSISVVAIVGAGLVAILQIYALLEFYLLAHDREDAVLACSGAASILFFVLLGSAGALKLSLEWFVCAVLLARGLHVVLLATVIKRVRLGRA